MQKPLSDASSAKDPPALLVDRHPYLVTALGCGLLGALLLAFDQLLAPTNIAMLLLLIVAVVAFRFGRGPAILASVFNVAAFDIGFIAPRGSFSVQDAEYLIVFVVMLAVALLISQLSGALRDRTQAALAGEQRQLELYELAAQLNATLDRDQVIAAASLFLQRSFGALVRFHPCDETDTEQLATPQGNLDSALNSVLASGLSVEVQVDDALRPVRNLRALKGATRLRGVLETQMPSALPAHQAQRLETLSTVAELVAAAVERLHYLNVAGRTQSEIEFERLRNSLLATLSHDLRTPLTVLYGHADALREAAVGIPLLKIQAEAVCHEALRTNRLCESLLDLARVGSSTGLPRREWVALEEVVGAALSALAGAPGISQVRTDIPDGLPWLQLDAFMFERALANLIDNALKQGGTDQDVLVSAAIDSDKVRLVVRNTGSRFPEHADQLLEAFSRGDCTNLASGFGIGLATCHAVVVAHGGDLLLGNRENAAEVEISLRIPAVAMPEPPELTSESPESVSG